METVTKKRVKVLTNAPIRAKGWAYGPITVPYFESTIVIFAMLREGIKVVEVLDNGTELELTSLNFEKDNNLAVAEEKAMLKSIPVDAHKLVEDVVVPVKRGVVAVPSEAHIIDVTPEVESVEEEPVVISQRTEEKPAKKDKKNKQ